MKKTFAIVLILIMAFSAVSAFTEGLPAYEPLAYSSNEFNDPIERMLSDAERAKEDLLFEDGCVVIPVANIYYMAGVPDTEDSVFNVYGTFHRDVYKLDGEVLERVAGITEQGYITLKRSEDETWTVTGEEFAQEGTYVEDLERIAEGNAELLAQYQDGENNEIFYENARKANIAGYAERNALQITGYRDSGGVVIPLYGLPAK